MKSKLKLKQITISGFKSFHPDGQTIPIDNITILLGANGSGKSNLVSFFKMLGYATTNALQVFIGENGYASSLLYYGSKRTPKLTAELFFSDENADDKYSFTLAHAAGDTLIFTEETIYCKYPGKEKPFLITFDPGVKESGLYKEAKEPSKTTCRVIYQLLKSIQVFQFHDTSKESRIRNSGYINDNKYLRSDGGNLAAFLYAMKINPSNDTYYQRIVRYIRQVMPQFGDFVLEPSALNENNIMLNWHELNDNHLFGPHQLSDGSLRFMAIAVLLLQPPEMLPPIIVIDEPELGLHPSAISSLAGMIKNASLNSQIIIATQSPRLIDEFNPHDIVVVERDKLKRATIIKQLNDIELATWLNDYSMSELWDKNIIGGRP